MNKGQLDLGLFRDIPLMQQERRLQLYCLSGAAITKESGKVQRRQRAIAFCSPPVIIL